MKVKVKIEVKKGNKICGPCRRCRPIYDTIIPFHSLFSLTCFTCFTRWVGPRWADLRCCFDPGVVYTLAPVHRSYVLAVDQISLDLVAAAPLLFSTLWPDATAVLVPVLLTLTTRPNRPSNTLLTPLTTHKLK